MISDTMTRRHALTIPPALLLVGWLIVEGERNYHNVSVTEPETMPIRIERGTTKTLKCMTSWGEFAGKNITVHIVPLEGSGSSLSAQTKFVKLDIGTRFNATDSAKYFNVTVINHENSAINLTLINVYFNYYTLIPHENISISLPKTLENGTLVSFDCIYNSNNTIDPTILVETAQGYIAYVTANVSATANVAIMTPLAFNESGWGGNESMHEYKRSKAIETAKAVFARRDKEFKKEDEEMFETIFNLTQEDRSKRGY